MSTIDPLPLARQLLNAVSDKPEAYSLIARAVAIMQPCHHGQDFACVRWFGTVHSFTPTQSAVVRILWTAWEEGIPDVRQETLLLAAGSESERIPPIFKDHKAWGTMIAPGLAKGTFRLQEPE